MPTTPPHFAMHTKHIELRYSPELNTTLDIRLSRPYLFVACTVLILIILAAIGSSLLTHSTAAPVPYRAVLYVQSGMVQILSANGGDTLYLTAGESTLLDVGTRVQATEGEALITFYDGSKHFLSQTEYIVTESSASLQQSRPTFFERIHTFFQELTPSPRHYNSAASVLG